MTKNLTIICLCFLLSIFLNGCENAKKEKTLASEPATTAEKVYMGDNFDSLFEGLPWETIQKVKKGDIIATKLPALFLDFNHTVAFNDYNSAMGKFVGWERVIVTSGKETKLLEFMKNAKASAK
jgi:hypothetical protein